MSARRGGRKRCRLVSHAYDEAVLVCGGVGATADDLRAPLIPVSTAGIEDLHVRVLKRCLS